MTIIIIIIIITQLITIINVTKVLDKMISRNLHSFETCVLHTRRTSTVAEMEKELIESFE